MNGSEGIVDKGLSVNLYIESLLSQRELSEPSGAPLFTYQLNANAYSRLRSLLQARLPCSASFKNPLWCASFCLFGAEWYRREYQSGWSWSGIFDALGFELEPSQRADVVIKGLAYWKRNVNRYASNRNDYLGSLFSEGGLPFSLLAAEGGRFQALFKRLLVEFDRAKSFGLSPLALIEKQLSSMPDAFQSESTVTLLHDMVGNLYALIDTYSLEQKNNPAEYLDSVTKSWRASFPIPLDIETGDKFLAGLLNSAAARRKVKKNEQTRLQLAQRLRNTNEISFSANIEVSKRFTIPLTRKDLTAPIVEVLVFEGNAQIADFGMARAEICESGIKLHMRKTEVSFGRNDYEAPLSVVIMQAGRVSYVEEIPNSSLPLNDMPVLLKQENEGLMVVGCGSASHKAEKLSLLIPNDAEIDKGRAIVLNSQHRGAYLQLSFSGELVINYSSAGGGDSYLVSNQEDSYNKASLEINGEQIEFPSYGGYPVYKGIPKIACHHPNSRIFIGDNDLDSRTNPSEFFGRQVLRVKAQGKTLYRKKIAILPQDFEINLSPAPSGRIVDTT